MDDGSTVLTYNFKNYRERKVFSSVNLSKFQAIVKALNLGPLTSVKLLLNLNKLRSIYDIGRATDTTSADTALDRWIGEIEKSIGRIASAKADDEVKFGEALRVLDRVGDDWAKQKLKADGNDIDLIRLGFEPQYFEGFTDSGAEIFIRRWFESARLIKQFAKDARKRLKELNRPQNRLQMSMSKETLIYGVQLPRLYKQITKQSFGVSKKADQVSRTGGVAFVLDCAECIGLPSVTPSNVASHWHKAKRVEG